MTPTLIKNWLELPDPMVLELQPFSLTFSGPPHPDFKPLEVPVLWSLD